jgi:RHS repeat-associated protein
VLFGISTCGAAGSRLGGRRGPFAAGALILLVALVTLLGASSGAVGASQRGRYLALQRDAAAAARLDSAARLYRASDTTHPSARFAGVAVGKQINRLRTADSRTFVGSHGTLVTRIYEQPVNYRASNGKLEPISDKLVPARNAARGAVENRANSYHVVLPVKLGNNAIHVTAEGQSVSFRLAGAAAVFGTTSGNETDYRGVLRGTNVSYTALSDAVKESIVIDRRNAPSTYMFPLRLSPGLVPKINPMGGIELVLANHRVAFTIPAPTVIAASGLSGDPFKNVSLHLRGNHGRYDLIVSVARAWLASAALPVTVDPTISISNSPTPDCWIISGYPTTSACADGYLLLGNYSSGDARDMFHFNTSAIPQDAIVVGATMGVDFEAGTTMYGVQAQGISPNNWTNSATWDSYDGTHAWNAPGGGLSATVTDSETVWNNAGFASWYVPGLVQGWVNNPATNNGVMLRADSSDTYRFGYNEQGTSTQSAWPYLQVSWAPNVGELPSDTFNSNSLTDKLGFDVNVASGDLELHDQALTIAGTGLNLDLNTYYSDQNLYQPGSLGAGDFNLYDAPGYALDGAIVGSPNGSTTLGFVIEGPNNSFRMFTPQANGTYTTPGLDATLSLSPSYNWVLSLNDSGETYTFSSSTGELLAHQDKSGDTITYNWTAYNGVQRLASIVDTQGRTTTVGYGSDGYISSLTDSTGRTVTFSRASSFVTSMTDANGGVTRYGYDANWNLNKITDPAGNVTNITYNGQRQVTSVTRVTNPATETGPTTTFSYSAPGAACGTGPDPNHPIVNQTTMTDPNGNQTTYCTDWYDRVAKMINAAGAVATTIYDSLGDPTTTVEFNGATTTTTYNTLSGGQLTSDPTSSTLNGSGTTLSAGTATYASTANPYLPTQTADTQGNATSYTYDQYGNPTTIVDALSAAGRWQNTAQDEIKLAYSSSHPGWLTQSTDPDGNTTSYGYDTYGNQTSITPPGPIAPETVGYDALSRETSEIDGLDQITTTTYDALDRVTKTSYAGGTSVTDSYDPDDNLISETDPSGTERATYNALNELTQTTLPSGQTISYGYDNNDNLTSVTDAGGTVTYAYNNLNELKTLTEPGGYNTTFAYDNEGNRTGITYPNGVTIAYTYDPANRPLTMIATNPGGSTIASETYTYTVGSTNTELLQTAKDQNGNVASYSYDPLDRLVEAKTVASGGATVSDYQYTYDGDGNRLTEVVNGASTGYTYNAADELTAIGAAGLTYDANGNETSNGTGSLTYNSGAQTTSVGSDSMAFFGNGQEDQTDATGAVLESNLLGLGVVTNGSSSDYITRDSSGNAIGERTPLGRYYFVTDARGTVLAVTDSNGNTVRNDTYDPYGDVVSSTGSGPDDLGYLGGYAGQPSGLDHFGVRLLDPSTGRWTQPDPMAASLVGDPTQDDPYVYAGDDPVNDVDAEGTDVAGAYFDAIQAKVEVCNSLRRARRKRNPYYQNWTVYWNCHLLYQKWGYGGPSGDAGGMFSCSAFAGAIGGLVGGAIGLALTDDPEVALKFTGPAGGAIGGLLGSTAC